MIQHKICLIGGLDDEFAIFTEDSANGRCRLNCEYRGTEIHAEADDFFDALCQIRLELEKEKLIPFCYGASLNVYPSGMARDMGAGKRAYKLKIGEPATTKNLVNIFAEGPDIIPVFVAVQKNFFKDWCDSK